MKYLWFLPMFFGGLFLYMFAFAKATKVREHDILIPVQKEEKPIRLFFISDIHRRKISKKLIALLNEEFDAVIIGGDLAEKGVPLRRIEENVKCLSALGPVYYIWGNNDREVGELNIKRIIESVEGKILENEADTIRMDRNHWMLCGVDDQSSGTLDLDQAFSSIQSSDITIFITHSPFVFKKAKKFDPYLMLAGHTHGGQIRVGRIGMFKNGSLTEESGRYKLVSNGYGTSLIPLRLGARPECHIIRINGQNN